MKIYIVYEEYQEERLSPEDMKFFTNKDQAIDEFNARKDNFLYSPDWEISDEFDRDDVTDVNNSVLFIHKTSQTEMYVNVISVQTEQEEDNE